MQPFIGRIRRTQVENDLFSTLDEVSIYLRDIKPLGVNLPFSRTVWLLTSWEVGEGIPLHSFEIREDSLRGTGFFLLALFSRSLISLRNDTASQDR